MVALDKKRIVFHLGTFKTGTSSIQTALAALPRTGTVLYPRSGLRTDEPETGVRHSRLCYGYVPEKMKAWEKMVANLIEEIRGSSAPTVVLSAEPWSRLKFHEGLRKIVCLLQENLSVEVEGVCYFRNRYSYARSLYREFTRHRGNSKPSQAYLRNVRDLFDYSAIAEGFNEIFNGRVTYAVTDRVDNAVAHFFSHIGANYQGRPLKINSGCSAVEAEMFRVANQMKLHTDACPAWAKMMALESRDLGERFTETLPMDVLESSADYWALLADRTSLTVSEVETLYRKPADRPELIDIALLRPYLEEIVRCVSVSNRGCGPRDKGMQHGGGENVAQASLTLRSKV